MTVKKYVLFVALLAGISNFSTYASEHERTSINNDELLSKLPTALLENLKRDLQSQEEKEKKTIDSIAGIPKDRLESEIIKRNSEDRSKTIGTRSIDPKSLPGPLLKYIAERGVSYEGCKPQDATNEIQARFGVVADFPSGLVANMQERHTNEKQEKSAEEFAKREDAEDLNATLEDIKENIEKGKDPSVAKQVEMVKEKEQHSKPTTTDTLQKVINGEQSTPVPHGYNEKAQNERTSDEIKNSQKDVATRGIMDEKTEEEMSLWEKVKKTIGNWLNGNEESNTPNTLKNETNNLLENEEVAKNLTSALTTAVEDAS